MKKRVLMLVCVLMALIMPATEWGGMRADAAVTPAVVEMSKEHAVIDMAESSKLTLSADVLPVGASQRVKWSSSDTSVVKVSSSGVVTARKRGVAIVTATAYGTDVKAQCVVAVIDSDVPERIEIGAPQLTLLKYQEYQLKADVQPATANQKVKWKTSKSSVVKVSSSGVLTARKAGTATITCYSAEDKTVLDTVVVTVRQQATPKSITLTPGTDVMVVGETLQLNAQQSPADSCIFFKWKSSSSSRASVTQDGLVTAKRTGWVTITCTSMQSSRVKATRKILVVSKTSPHKITLEDETITLYAGDTYQLEPSVLPAGKDERVSYKTSRSSVAGVSAGGVITAKKAGTATITVTSRANKNVTAKLTVKVQALPAPDSLTITAPSSKVAKGDTLQLVAVPYPLRSSAEVKWTSSDTNVARVSSSGVVTARRGGSAVITAVSKKDSGIRAAFTVTVSDPDSPTSVRLNASVITMEVGEEREIEAAVYPADCKNKGLKWSSSANSTAKVSSSGTITARRTGTAVITAASSYNSSVRSSVMVTVINRAAPTSISAGIGRGEMKIGETAQISVTVKPSAASKLFKYSSSNKNVLSVSEDGQLTAKKAGQATITVRSAKSSSVKAAFTILVYDATTPRSVALNQSILYLGQDDKAALKATVLPADALQTVLWKSSNTSVAKVSDTGVITAMGDGTATITCTTKKGGLTAQCTVHVLDTTLTTEIPARTTKISGIAGNLAKIEAIRKSAVNQVLSLAMSGKISGTEAAARQNVINRAFEMQAFPWMTKKTQEYWNKQFAYKRYVPDTVYYGLPYIQTGPSYGYLNRRYNVEKALDEKRYTSTGKGYYLLNQSKLVDGMYCGNDCSSFVSMAQFGTNHAASYLNTTAIVKSSYYKTISSYDKLRPGDLLVKGGDHTILFLYYVDPLKTKMMIIEQGGDGSTVICSVHNTAQYTSKGYIPRRQTTFSMN